MSVQARIDGYWSGRAPSYDEYQRSVAATYDAAWERVWRPALPPAPADVLDIGTGPGTVACLLAGLGHRVTAIDSAEGMLRVARQHAAAMANGPTVLTGDAVAPAFPDGTFDAVVGRYVMWTLREPGRALAAWRRLLRPGGRLALVDATWFPGGVDRSETASPELATTYDDEVWAALPVATATSIEATADLVRAAGYGDVRVEPLSEILALDREHGVAPGHEVREQFLITARVRDR